MWLTDCLPELLCKKYNGRSLLTVSYNILLGKVYGVMPEYVLIKAVL